MDPIETKFLRIEHVFKLLQALGSVDCALIEKSCQSPIGQLLVFQVPELNLSSKAESVWARKCFEYVGQTVGYDPHFSGDDRPHIYMEELLRFIFSEDAELEETSVILRMVLQRFSSERYGYHNDAFSSDLDTFRLDWTNPKALPPETEECPVHGYNFSKCDILSREDVVAAKDFYRGLEAFEKVPKVRTAIDFLRANDSETSFKDMIIHSLKRVSGNDQLSLVY